MKKKVSRFEETRREKFINKIKEKRFYIVLLCCIMAVSATYFVVDSFVSKIPETPKMNSNLPKASATPLPDLTKKRPQETQQPSPAQTAAAPQKKTSSAAKSTPMPTSSPKAAPANEVSAQANIDYNSREKSTLSYPLNGEVITPHAVETLIYSQTLDDWRSHVGIDIKSAVGTEVRAADDGIIADIYTDDFMGIVIIIDHQNGIKTLYANLSNSNLVQKGQQVSRGTVISAVGDTSVAESGTEAHLHFEVYDSGTAVDPVSMLEN